MNTKTQEIKQRTHTFLCKKCDIIFKVDIHDTQARQMREVFCPLCKGKIK
jgi:predicted SprT family Zn-dependent metalloprotease